MIQITKGEQKTILDRFPWAEIKTTRHKAYLIGRDGSEPVRLLLSIRGLPQPLSRRDKIRLNNKINSQR